MADCKVCGIEIRGGIFCKTCEGKRRREYNKHPDRFGFISCKKCQTGHWAGDKCRRK